MLSADRELRMWIQEHKSESSTESVRLAEAYQTAHKTMVNPNRNMQFKAQSENQTKIMQGNSGKQGQQKREIRTCFSCNRQGHISPDCPLMNTQRKQFTENNKGKLGLCLDNGKSQSNKHINDEVSGQVIGLPGVQYNADGNKENFSGFEIVDGKVNGRDVTVLRDTGSSTVIVHNKFVTEGNYTGNSREICLADGTSKECKEALVDIIAPFISRKVIALVLNSPLADLNKGNFVKTQPQY